MRRNNTFMKKILLEIAFLLVIVVILIICTINVYGELIKTSWVNTLIEGVGVILGIGGVILILKVFADGMKS